MPSAFNEAGFGHAAGHWRWTVLGMAGHPDGAAAEAFDVVLPVPGLHFEKRSGRKSRTVYVLG